MEKAPINPIEIRQVTEAEQTRAVAHELYVVARSGFEGESPWNAESLFQSITAKSSAVFYAAAGGKKVGFLVASETAFVLDIYIVVVAAPYKNQKIGRLLFEALIKYAKEKQIEEIVLETRKSNKPAIALYERMGFQKAGVRRAYYSSPIEDAVVMKRTVREGK